MKNSVSAYQKNDTLGKSPIELVLKVYNGAISSFEQAKTAIGKNDTELTQTHLEKARKFITHLYTTLNMEEGGEIALQLSQLYSFIINQINIIEATKDLSLIDDNIQVLKNLQEGWVELKDTQNGANKEIVQPENSIAELSVTG